MSISHLSTLPWQQNTSALCNEFGNICYLFPQHSSDVHQILHSNSPFKSPPSLFLFFSDYGVDRSRVWEQRAHQLGWGSQLPEVSPHFLCPKPSIPPHCRRLGLGLQSWPEGKPSPNVTFVFCPCPGSKLQHPWSNFLLLYYFYFVQF